MIILSKVKVIFNSVYNNKPIFFTIFNKENSELNQNISKIMPASNIELYLNTDIDWGTNDSVPPLYFRQEKSEYFRDICLREQTEYDFVISFPLSKEQIKETQVKSNNPIYPITNLKLLNIITYNNSNTWYEKDGYTYLSGRINFKNYIGITKFHFDNSITTDRFEVEVVSYKISYEEDFRYLLKELTEIQTELILSLDDPTEVSLYSNTLVQETSNQVLLLHLRRLMSKDRLPLAVQTILSNPHAKLTYDTEIERIGFPGLMDLAELSSNPFNLSWKKGGELSGTFKGYTPLEYYKENIEKTFDTKENQYIKFSLEELERIVSNLLFNLPNSNSNSKQFLQHVLMKIEDFLQNPIFKQIGNLSTLPNSMVLQRKNGYKEFLSNMQHFDTGLQLESDIGEFDTIDGDLRPISELYEYWCFFQIFGILKELLNTDDVDVSSLITRNKKGYKLNLKKSGSNGCYVTFNLKGQCIKLYYNRNFTHYQDNTWEGTYDKGLLHPDISLSIETPHQTHWIHFDAKYKLNQTTLEKFILGKEISEGNYLRNDIHTVHAYRDAILGTRAAFILYPDLYEKETIFIRQPNPNYREKFLIPSVGAFPIRPGSSNLKQRENLTKFFKTLLKFTQDSSYYYFEEIGFLKTEVKEP